MTYGKNLDDAAYLRDTLAAEVEAIALGMTPSDDLDVTPHDAIKMILVAACRIADRTANPLSVDRLEALFKEYIDWKRHGDTDGLGVSLKHEP